MGKRNDWMPYTASERKELFINVLGKIDGYATVLDLTPAQIARIKVICEVCVYALTAIEQAKATQKSLVSWKNMIMANEVSGDALMARPQFDNSPPPGGASIGMMAEFRKLMEAVRASAGFTRAIAADLMIAPPTRFARNLAEVAPEIKVANIGRHSFKITGSLDGMDAMRVEYRRKGGETWQTAAFLTHLPAEIEIEPTVAGDPESIDVRCILIKRNKPVGQYSQVARVTLSAE